MTLIGIGEANVKLKDHVHYFQYSYIFLLLDLQNHLISIKCLTEETGNVLFWSYLSTEPHKTAIMPVILWVNLGLSS